MLPKDALPFLGRDAARGEVLIKLVKSELWADNGREYVLTDYLDHQLSQERRNELCKGWRENKREQRNTGR